MKNDESLINDVCERDDKAIYRKGFNDKVKRNKAKVLGSRFL